MAVASSAKVFAAAALWRMGVTGAGRSIVVAAAGGDEDTSTIAGVLLTRAGDRAVPLVTEAIESGADALILIDILASIGTDAALEQLRTLTGAADPEVAQTARYAVDRLDKRRGRRGN